MKPRRTVAGLAALAALTLGWAAPAGANESPDGPPPCPPDTDDVIYVCTSVPRIPPVSPIPPVGPTPTPTPYPTPTPRPSPTPTPGVPYPDTYPFPVIPGVPPWWERLVPATPTLPIWVPLPTCVIMNNCGSGVGDEVVAYAGGYAGSWGPASPFDALIAQAEAERQS